MDAINSRDEMTVSKRYPSTLWHIRYNDVIMVRWRLKSPVSPLFTQPLIQAQIEENIKAPRHWPLCGEFTGDAENVSIWWRHHIRGLVSHSVYHQVYTQVCCVVISCGYSVVLWGFMNCWWGEIFAHSIRGCCTRRLVFVEDRTML